MSLNLSTILAFIVLIQYGHCTFEGGPPRQQEVYNVNPNYQAGYPVQPLPAPYAPVPQQPNGSYAAYKPAPGVQPVPPPVYPEKSTYSTGPNQGQYNVQAGYPIAPQPYQPTQISYPNSQVIPNQTYLPGYPSPNPGSKLNQFTDAIRNNPAQKATYNGNAAYDYTVQKPPHTVFPVDPYSQVAPPAYPNSYSSQPQTSTVAPSTDSHGFWKFLQIFHLPKFDWGKTTTTTTTTTPAPAYIYPQTAPVYPYSNPPQQSYSALNPNYYQPPHPQVPAPIAPQTVLLPTSYNTNNYYQTSALQPGRQPQGLYQVFPPNSKNRYSQPQAPLPMHFTYPAAPPPHGYNQQYTYTVVQSTPRTSTTTPAPYTTTSTAAPPTTPKPYPSKEVYPPNVQPPQTAYSLYLVPGKPYETQQPSNTYNPAPNPHNQQPYSEYKQTQQYQQQYAQPKQPYQPNFRPVQPYDTIRPSYELSYPQGAPQYYGAPVPQQQYYPTYLQTHPVATTITTTTKKPDCDDDADSRASVKKVQDAPKVIPVATTSKSNARHDEITSVVSVAAEVPVIAAEVPVTAANVAVTPANVAVTASDDSITTIDTPESTSVAATAANQPQARRLFSNTEEAWKQLLSI